MKMYSPFHNEQNEFLSINKVTYAELDQLNTLDEGYHLEFKLNFNDSVKKKIPAIISSFANSSGGWIVIGIEDKSKNIVPIKKERNDFGQIISQLLKGSVTPIPQYEVRFLECPDTESSGVLLIYVYEGNYTPYISDGTIYIRNGSSKEPVQRADRATIELLMDKSNQHKKTIEMFFKRDIEFPYNNLAHKTREYSLCNIFIKNLTEINIFKTYQDKEKMKTYIIQDKESIFHSAQFDLDSILFRHKTITPFDNGITMLYELYSDMSTKIHIPLTTMDDFDNQYAINRICECMPSGRDENARCKIIDGVLALDCIWASTKKHFDLLKSYNISISDLVLQMECEDIGNTILYFDCPLYYEYIKENGLCFSQKQEEKTKIMYFKDYDDLQYEQLDQAIAFDLFAYMFGFHPDKVFEIHREAQKIKYPDMFEEK